MAYTLVKSDGTNIIVTDNTKDTTTLSLTLIGRYFPGYGQILNNNTLRLLENFSNISPPAHPIAGQLWWDSSAAKELKVWNGTSWSAIAPPVANTGGLTISATTPSITDPSVFWWDSNSGELFVKYQDIDSTQWVGVTASSSSATIPAATTTVLGGVIVPTASGLSIVNGSLGINVGTGLSVVGNQLVSSGEPTANKSDDVTMAANSPTLFPTQHAVKTYVGSGALPVGSIIDFAGVAAPAGFLVCPIAAANISRTTYATLFAAIGTTWGIGDGSTTFGLPWFPTDYTSVHNPGAVGQQTVGQVINHVHTVSGNQATNNTYGSGTATAYDGAGTTNTGNPTIGGPANLAAGSRVLKCIKYM